MPWERVNTDAKPRSLSIGLHGGQKTAKSHTLLTASELGPLYVYNFDLGLDEVFPKFTGREIYQAKYSPELLEPHVPWQDLRKFLDNQLLPDMHDALAHGRKRGPGSVTVGMDMVTQFWPLVQDAFIGEIRERREKLAKSGEEVRIYPYDYKDANKFMNALLRMPTEAEVNAIWIAESKAVWDASGPTGQYEPSWFGALPYRVKLVLRAWKRTRTVKEDGKDRKVIEQVVTFEDCRFDSDYEGMTWTRPGIMKYAEEFLDMDAIRAGIAERETK